MLFKCSASVSSDFSPFKTFGTGTGMRGKAVLASAWYVFTKNRSVLYCIEVTYCKLKFGVKFLFP
ncbi:hypothetical protein VCRA2123O444_420004 [Vibrio crassostreae]|nr:hypothetical protein VCRA2114O421_380004 [Vibrio crassostreae]CAK2050427.1 hypothetical protein VCRA2113O411_380004 [Vibrio crassostreae]CAK2088180.1 hypothetical protein VCRA2117O428_400021 [Vibrio crassostreae]CAK2089021.1 hypothetical protein VCRA2113O416_410004 [Vibrio crassostreae]CAK2096140.1 hypothetical protein VCRA2119O431_410004 [Vibrio crassostreae]